MSKSALSLILMLALVALVKAQGHGSCDKAVLIDTSSYGPVYADGYAEPLLSIPHTDGTYFEKPHTAVWFCIDIPYDTLLTFDLVPQNPTDDLDFLLFKDETSEITNCIACRGAARNFCDREKLNRMKPIRTNIAHTDTSLKGWTGLSATAKDNMEPPGKHPVYSKALPVKKDERYYLVVDNYTSAKRPFTLLIHFRFPQDSIVETVVSSTNNPVIKTKPWNGEVPVYIIDSLTKNPVKAKIEIEWTIPNDKEPVDTTSAVFPIKLKKGQKINITASAKGYLLGQLTYTAQTDSDKAIYIDMLQIKEHMKMIFKHMEFEKGTAKFLPSATESLNALLEFMLNNPKVKILIKGYVNDPYQVYDAQYDLDLSKQRAEAVYNFLASKGIERKRLDWRGLGNKEMVYPKPANDDEMEANRRVEVEIVK